MSRKYANQTLAGTHFEADYKRNWGFEIPGNLSMPENII